MKKLILFLFVTVTALSLFGCGENSPDVPGSAPGTENMEAAVPGESTGQRTGNENQSSDNLHFLARLDENGCYTENGYYYLTQEAEKLSDGNYGSHLMYVDFAAQQEIYLCSNTGCTHNTLDCPSVFNYDEVPYASTLIFTYNGYLYLLAKEQDPEDAGVSVSASGDDANIENAAAVLYRTNLDGTSREKVYEFDASVALEDFVLGDGSGIYVVTKKISTEISNDGTYSTSSERRLVFIDLNSKSESTVCSMDFNDNICWRVVGCYEHTLVLQGRDFGRKVSKEELFDDDAAKELHKNSEEVFATLDLNSGKISESYRLGNEREYSAFFSENMLYLSYSDDGSIMGVDLKSKEEKEIAVLPNNNIYYVIDDKLCCRSWGADDYSYYYVDVNTGNISHSKLVNKCTGWSLEFRAVLDADVLVIYDYDAVETETGSYLVSGYQYGLISKADLFNGVDNYREIKMIEGGN